MSALALFDFDGTITFSDTWTPFMRLAIRPRRMLAARILLGPVVVGYRLGLVTASTGRVIAARVAFAGEDAAAIRCLGRDYAARTLPARIRPAAIDRIEWHRSRGDDVVVVSGSLDVYLRPWCEQQGVACICATLEDRNGRLTGRYVDGDCSGAEKVRRILERYRAERYDEIYAYGDSGEDRELLELANRRYYRWTEVRSWSEVRHHEHPAAH